MRLPVSLTEEGMKRTLDGDEVMKAGEHRREANSDNRRAVAMATRNAAFR